MAEQNQQSSVPNDAQSEYTAPEIETVVTPENLEREVQYAGSNSGQVV